MPLFEYHCKKCNTIREILVKTADEQVVCPNCGSKNMEKMMSHFSPLGTSRKRVNVGCVEDPSYRCEPGSSGSCCGCQLNPS